MYILGHSQIQYYTYTESESDLVYTPFLTDFFSRVPVSSMIIYITTVIGYPREKISPLSVYMKQG